MIKSKIFIIITVLTITLVSLQVYLTSSRATEGDELVGLETQLSAISIENEQMASNIFNLTSISKVKEFAENNHMIPATLSNLSVAAVAARVQ